MIVFLIDLGLNQHDIADVQQKDAMFSVLDKILTDSESYKNKQLI